MKYFDEFRNSTIAKHLAHEISDITGDREMTFMEVCGGHTIAIFKYGIRELLPKGIRLISGPGCPVCVSPTSYIDYAVALSRQEKVTISTFGDMIKVPGSSSNLRQEKAQGADIRVVYSAMDALQIAHDNRDSKIVFLGIGFETTAPTIAATIMQARVAKLNNFFVLSTLKTMPNALKALLDGGNLGIQGFICPGHVSTITGLGIYNFIASDYHVPCVISGFEATDLLQTILMLAQQVSQGISKVENQYTRGVKPEGNPIAQKLINEVFEPCDSEWRGLGIIPGSGLAIKEEFSEFDAYRHFEVKIEPSHDNPNCICGDIMRGAQTPLECKLFKKICTPENPVGACMVSNEGTCATYFKYT
jgi:hydrogenase expression/formation protein HypD